ncbi:ATP-binding protein [Iningainema tapete]|uniref:histidine kinase n=1 Tax=Iningainema tapete BLCC-T55 TaxID=2748662 RepID=A0A8J6XYK1_9CYAN|nr:ATP-binding protein [Iningainema tapete]MBD2775453.1 response regulator [Iningainema tapete BLCC-T55]
MSNTWTILIIDDCAEDREAYRRYLLRNSDQSYQILEADSAEDGLALCKEIHCDLILVDFCLPSMNGLEFLDRLKQQLNQTPVPVIMLTAYGDEEVAVAAMKSGAHDYLVKQHLKADVLKLAVRNAIKQSHLQKLLGKTQERQRLIYTTALRIRQSLNLEETLKTTVAEVRQLLKCDRVVVFQFINDTNGLVVAESVGQNFCVTYGIEIKETYFQQTKGINYEGNKQTITNIHNAELSDCYRNLLERFEVKANLAVPILLSNSGNKIPKLWGLLIAHQCSQERQWQVDEVNILDELSVQLAIAIQQAELLAQTQAALEKQKQLNEFRSQIIATVSHEYRTPLASILAAASTVKQNSHKLDESRKQRFLQIIEQKVRHMSKLVDDMLVVNQFELNKTKFKPVSLNLNQFFAELIDELQQLTSEQHKLIFKVTGNNFSFCGDKGLLRQIFSNLMSNAIKYSPEGGNIEFHLIEEETQIVFSVQDWGIGIPTKDQENLFQSFCRGGNVGTISGTGLGLVITKACVDLHGGKITLSSQLGQGTKVTVSLPSSICP